MMDMYDADQDGALSDAERAAMRESRVVDMIGRLDANEDGRLTEDEFAQFGARGRGPALDFATVDADHDGAISAEEMSAALPARGPGDRPPGARPGRRGSDDGAPPAPPTP
ncbi:MAG: EF-hand domain-containing protein [Myxococcales bacterium]|nr:EF-hand domain-containing protein [Myxococcales bacterium]